MVTEDGLALLITRLESKAVQSSENRKLYEVERKARINFDDRCRSLEVQVRSAKDERDEAIRKIEEWAAYAAHLRAMLKSRKVADKKLPAAPKAIETEIPF